MTSAAPRLFSAKGGKVRGCLSGSLWLKSVALGSPLSPTLPASPGSATKFRLLPAPGARSKLSSMAARLILKAASEYTGGEMSFTGFCFAQQPLLVFYYTKTRLISLSWSAFSPNRRPTPVYTQLIFGHFLQQQTRCSWLSMAVFDIRI